MATPQTGSRVCPEKLRLSKAFVKAVQEVMKLQNQEMARVLDRGAGLDRFKVALEAARAKRETAKRVYQRHVEEHGC